jgi:hypothetical protein
MVICKDCEHWSLGKNQTAKENERRYCEMLSSELYAGKIPFEISWSQGLRAVFTGMNFGCTLGELRK